MPDKTASNFYPAPTGNQTTDQAMRLAFDYIYQLRGRLGKLEAPAEQKPDLVTPGAIVENPPFGQHKECEPTAFTHPKPAASGLANTYVTLERQNWIYLLGDDNTDGHLQIYRLGQDNVPVKLSDLTLSAKYTRMVVSGPYAFLCRVGSGSSNLAVVSVTKPNNPQEITAFGVGATAKGLAVQGRYVYVATDGPAVKIIDVSVPSSPRLVATAT